MGRCVVAFAPGHISGFFKRVDGPTAAETGSLGAGIVIGYGVKVAMKPAAKTAITIKGGEADPAFLTEAINALGINAEVYAEAELPIGAGFGMSAACLLAAAAAANRLFDLGMSSRDIVSFAHKFEVEHGTGLGDAAASAAGGVDFRTAPGIDGVSKRIPSDEMIYAVSLGGIATPDVIGSADAMQQVKNAYPDTVPETLADVFTLSRSFAEKSSLITGKVRTLLNACDAAGILASMTMLGEGVFACGSRAPEVLGQFGHVYAFPVSKTGPVILEDSNV